MNIWSLRLKFMAFDGQYEALSKMLDTYMAAIGQAKKEFQKEAQPDSSDYQEVFSEEQSDFVENLYGCSMVACQTYITFVVSRVKSLHDAQAKRSTTLSTTSGKKPDIMVKFSSKSTGSTYTQIQIIDALANYYKHADEWRPDWTKMQGQSAETISIISTVGLKSGSSNNLTTGVNAVGGLKPIPEIIRIWQSQLAKAYNDELQTLGLIGKEDSR